MTIELTEQQQQVLDAQTEQFPRVLDPRTNTSYLLIPAADYETIRGLLEEERRQKGIRAVGLGNAVGRISEAR